MATAGEKFFSALTNAEYRYLETYVGCLAQNWETQASGFDINIATLIVAMRRAGDKPDEKEIKNLTPAQTNERLEATLEKLGYVDDEDTDAEDLVTETES